MCMTISVALCVCVCGVCVCVCVCVCGAGDIEFRLSFLPIYQLFDGTEQRQGEVYDKYEHYFLVSVCYSDLIFLCGAKRDSGI